MKRIDTLIIGGGQAGLAMSRCLADRGIDHVVLEKGRVAERWRTERWDSLRLLTPNWQSRLPGWTYQGNDPDGFMTMPQVIDYLEGYARSFSAPVMEETTVLEVSRAESGYRVRSDRGEWSAANVVIATGQCGTPLIPGMARDLPGSIHQTVPTRYRNPGTLPDGGVLVVGASASGLQLADELQRSGRQVTLAVGRHTRLPRTYRGKDIMHWLDRMGVLDESIDDVGDLKSSRNQPSLQLVGRPDRTSLDLPALQQSGVRLVGRAVAVDGRRIRFADDLDVYTDAADRKLARLLERIDDHISLSGMTEPACDAGPRMPFVPEPAPTELDLRLAGIRTVIWATGFRGSYPWLKVPVLDERGEILHDGGITAARGLYVLGLRFLRRRKSTFIDGVGDDARDLAAHLASRLARRDTRAA